MVSIIFFEIVHSHTLGEMIQFDYFFNLGWNSHLAYYCWWFWNPANQLIWIIPLITGFHVYNRIYIYICVCTCTYIDIYYTYDMYNHINWCRRFERTINSMKPWCIPAPKTVLLLLQEKEIAGFWNTTGAVGIWAWPKKGTPKNQMGLVGPLKWPESSSEQFFVGSAHNLSIKPRDLIFFAWLGPNNWSGGDIERWWGWQHVQFVNKWMSRAIDS